MKTLRFLIIGLVVIILSSCGGKEKITTENGVEILSEVLDYPRVITKDLTWSGYYYEKQGMQGLQKKLRLEGILEDGDNTVKERVFLGRVYKDVYIKLEPTSLMRKYTPTGSNYTCKVFSDINSNCTTEFALYYETIDTILEVSTEEESEVTVHYEVGRHFSVLGRYSMNQPGPFGVDRQLSESETRSITLQRTEDGWMSLEPQETDNGIVKTRSMSEFPYLVEEMNDRSMYETAY